MPAYRGILFSVLTAGLVAGLAPPAWATIDNFKSYKQAYPGKDPKGYSCQVCHDGVMGNAKNLNAYGKALKAFKTVAPADAKHLTGEDYRAFDAADSDGDGATNLQELEAGTDLADPASIPKGTGATVGSNGAVQQKTSSGEAPESSPELKPGGGK